MTLPTPLHPEFAEFVSETFAKQGFMSALNAILLEVTPGEVQIAAPIRPETSQQDGFGHAGLGWTIGDTAAGFAALSLMGPEERVLTIEMKTNLMAPARGERLVAEGSVVRFGGRLVTVKSEVFAEAPGERLHVATMLGTMMRLR